MTTKRKKTVQIIFGFALIGLMFYVAYLFLSLIWKALNNVDSTLAVGVVTGASTIVVATITVVIGKYYERKKEVEAHFRNDKIKIYDEFLKEFFKLFGGENELDEEQNLTEFLREWQRKMVLYGGAKVLLSYLKWKIHLGNGKPDAQTFFLMGDFFLEMRKDIGLSTVGLDKGVFLHLILKHPEIFLKMASENPNVTLEEFGAMEKALGLEK